MGYTHIATAHAAAIAGFFQEHLNPYLNIHRPCGVPELVVNAKGKEKRAYRWYATPWEILLAQSNPTTKPEKFLPDLRSAVLYAVN
jgi:hypothetical protein